MDKYNEAKFKYSRFNLHEYNGKGIHVALIDAYVENQIEHGDFTEEVVHTVSKYSSLGNSDEIITHRINYLLSTRGKLNAVKELIDKGQCDILSISAHGFKLDTAKTRKLYKYIAENCFIIAASGNSGTQVSYYPSSGDACLSVSACDYNSISKKSNWLSYSTRNNKVDVCNFSNIMVTARDEKLEETRRFGGTSCATPYTASLVARLMQWFKETYGRKPLYKEINSMLFNFCENVKVKGKELVLPNVYVGKGIPRMPLRFYPNWCSLHFSYLEEKFNCKKIIPNKQNQYLLATDFSQYVTRFEQIRLIAKCLGCELELTQDGFKDYCIDNGCPIDGKVIDGKIGMYYDSNMLRCEEIAFLSKAHSKGLVKDLEQPTEVWIKEYLINKKKELKKLYPSFAVLEVFDIVKNKWYWKYYKYFNDNIGVLNGFDPMRQTQRAESIKMTALAFDFI